jgi:parallel beta-helix repeat protein
MAGLVFLALAVGLFVLQRLRIGKAAARHAAAQSREFKRIILTAVPAGAGAGVPAGHQFLDRHPGPATRPRASQRANSDRRLKFPRRRWVSWTALALLVPVVAAAGIIVAGKRAEARSMRVVVRQNAAGVDHVEIAAGTLDLPALSASLHRGGNSDILVRSGSGWLLRYPVWINKGAGLRVRKTVLRLRSEAAGLVSLEARGGALHIDRATITSWDPTTAKADTDLADGRSWVVARDGGTMDVRASRVERLGYDDDRPGIAWRMPGTTGSVDGSTFSGNFYGLSTDGVESMSLRNSVVERSQRHGFDPRSDGRGLVVENNVFRYNGRYGLLVVACPAARVTGNQVYRNREHGIVVYSGSDEASVRSNLVHDNGGIGINVNRSSGATLAANTVYANRTGIGAQQQSAGLVIEGNRITANREDGVRVGQGSAIERMTANALDHNSRAGVYVDAGAAQVGPDNRVTDNETGVWLSVKARGAVIEGNTIAANVLDGMHLTGSKVDATINGNTIRDNRKAAFSVTARGVGERFTDGNDITQKVLERVRVEEKAGALRKGEVGQALDAGDG